MPPELLSMPRPNPYSNVVCPECDRRIPLDQDGLLPKECPVCGEPVVARDTPEERQERHEGYARAIMSSRRFPPGTGPFRPPEATVGTGEERWQEGRSLEVRPSGLVVPATQSTQESPRWRPPANYRPFDKTKHSVVEIKRTDLSLDTGVLRPSAAWDEALDFIQQHHYAGNLPNYQPGDTVIHGLYSDRDGLVGVALYISQPGGAYVKGLGPASIVNVFPGGISEALELNRFVLKPEVGYNGETWFLSRSRELLQKHGYRGFISFSDPHTRITDEGLVVKPGHYGTIYKGSGLVYLGQGKPDAFWFKPDMTLLIYPTGETKIRHGKRGWANQVQELVNLGASVPSSLRTGVWDGEELNAWLDRWLPRLGRKIQAPGKHKFAFLTDPTKERHLRRLGRLAGYERWSEEPVAVPYPSGRPGTTIETGIRRYGEVYPEAPAEPERGVDITDSTLARMRARRIRRAR
jgi:hypothetical protein